MASLIHPLQLQPYQPIENQNLPITPPVFSKYAWIKKPYYQARQAISSIYELALKLLQAALFFAPQKIQQGLSHRITAASIHALHWKLKQLALSHYALFQDQLLQHTLNVGRLDVLVEDKDREFARPFLQNSRLEFELCMKEYLHEVTLEMAERDFSHLDEPIRQTRINRFLEGEKRENDHMVQEYISSLPDSKNLEHSLTGTCGMTVIDFAARYLIENKSWLELARDSSEGMDERIAGLQMIYTAFYDKKISYFSKLAALSLGINMFPVSEITTEQTDDANIHAILNLPNGIYRLTFETRDSAHAILYHRENERIHIIDPNIGLLANQRMQAFSLFDRVIACYPLPENRTHHALEANRFEIAPPDDQLPWKRIFLERAISIG